MAKLHHKKYSAQYKYGAAAARRGFESQAEEEDNIGFGDNGDDDDDGTAQYYC